MLVFIYYCSHAFFLRCSVYTLLFARIFFALKGWGERETNKMHNLCYELVGTNVIVLAVVDELER